MTFRYSEALRNAGIDARIARIGPAPHLKLFAEPEPHELSDPDPGTPLATLVLPQQWMGKAHNGMANNKSMWTGTGSAEGEVRSFRICTADGNCHIQGGVPDDLKLDNAKIAPAQQVGVRVFAIAAGNG